MDQVEVGADRVDGGMHLRRRAVQGSGGQRSQVASDHVSPRDQRLPVRLPRLGKGLQHLTERRPARLRLGREIGAGEEWAAVGCEEGRQWPATRSFIHELRGRHEDLSSTGCCSRSTLTGTKCVLMNSAVSGSSNDSWLIT